MAISIPVLLCVALLVNDSSKMCYGNTLKSRGRGKKSLRIKKLSVKRRWRHRAASCGVLRFKNKLERVEANGIVFFPKATGLLSKDAARATIDLMELRNAYAHARGKNPNEDAIKAVSIFKGFDLQHGVMMFKDLNIKNGGMKAKRIAYKPSVDHTP